MERLTFWMKDVRTAFYSLFGTLLFFSNLIFARRLFLNRGKYVLPFIYWILRQYMFLLFLSISTFLCFIIFLGFSFFLLNAARSEGGERWNTRRWLFSVFLTFHFLLFYSNIYLVDPNLGVICTPSIVIFLKIVLVSLRPQKIFSWRECFTVLKREINSLYIYFATASPLKKLKSLLYTFRKEFTSTLTTPKLKIAWKYFAILILLIFVFPPATLMGIYYFSTKILRIKELSSIERSYMIVTSKQGLGVLFTFFMVAIMILTMTYVLMKLAQKTFTSQGT